MIPVIAGLTGALLTTIITAYINRRSKSGKINTSEASDLWNTLRGELLRLQNEATSLRSEMSVARIEMVALREETLSLRNNIYDLERQLVDCQEREKKENQTLL